MRRAWIVSLRTLSTALSFALLAGCASVRAQPKEPGRTLAVAGPTLGERQFDPTQCFSGQRAVFLGADWIDERADMVVRLAVDPIDGPAVKILERTKGDGPTIVLRPADCKIFEPGIEPTGSWVNGISELKVKLELDCTTKDGDSVVGKLEPTTCR